MCGLSVGALFVGWFVLLFRRFLPAMGAVVVCLRVVFDFGSGLGCCLWCFSLCALALWLLVCVCCVCGCIVCLGCCFGWVCFTAGGRVIVACNVMF